MSGRAAAARAPGIGDEAVRARTVRGWAQWFRVLDAAGAGRMSHKQIAAALHERYHLGGWWAQMVTVAYERARGRREKHEGPLAIRKATRNRSLRITWKDGTTSLEVYFHPRGARKSQVSVQHTKLADRKAADRAKAFWERRLEGLRRQVEDQGST